MAREIPIEEGDLRGYLFYLSREEDEDFVSGDLIIDALLEIPAIGLQGAAAVEGIDDLYGEDSDIAQGLHCIATTMRAMSMRQRFNPRIKCPFLIKTEFSMSREDIQQYIKGLEAQGADKIRGFLRSAKV